MLPFPFSGSQELGREKPGSQTFLKGPAQPELPTHRQVRLVSRGEYTGLICQGGDSEGLPGWGWNPG